MSELAHLTQAIEGLTHELRADTIRHQTDRILDRIQQLENKIMATQAEIAAQLRTQTDVINKIGVETDKSLQLIKDLQTAVDNQTNATPELIDAANALAAQLKIVDDKVPDTLPPTP
jgi:ribosomal protein RSM22 (predicted rRNA methylase)